MLELRPFQKHLSGSLWSATAISVLTLSVLWFGDEATALGASGNINLAPQLLNGGDGGNKPALSLNSTPSSPLLGRFGLTARDVLLELAPNLAGARLIQTRVATSPGGDSVHEEYSLAFGRYELAGAFLNLHHYKNHLALVAANLPDIRLPADALTDSDFAPLPALGFALPEGKSPVAERVIATSGGMATLAWRVRHYDRIRGTTLERLIDAQNGAVLEEHDDGFDIAPSATVFEHNPFDAGTIKVQLPNLSGDGFLDGTTFSVFAPDDTTARATPVDGDFSFLPDDPAESLSFDQAQAYYTSTKVLGFFVERFGYDAGKDHLIVRVNDIVGGQAGNAAYIPPTAGGPEIIIGKGDDEHRNLARDTDVIAHEFTHHVLFPHLPTARGEAGILHEGTADYFAYAFNGDPNLGESVVPGEPYLRTAALAPTDVFDASDPTRDSHWRGQYWSAVLWELHQKLGQDADKIVYESFSYFTAGTGIKEAFLALLNADRDLNPLAATDPEHGVFGANKCAILAAGVGRGFGFALGDFDGASCGQDLVAISASSRATIDRVANEPVAPAGGRRVAISLFGKTCSSIGASPAVSASAARSAMALFLTPIVFGAVLAVARRRPRTNQVMRAPKGEP